jgi:hypothetical protein
MGVIISTYKAALVNRKVKGLFGNVYVIFSGESQVSTWGGSRQDFKAWQ